MISALVVNRDRIELLSECLESVQVALARVPGPTELIVIDNGSTDGSVEWVASHAPEARLLVNRTNVGFAPAVAQGVALATKKWVALINNDAVLDPDCLRLMIERGEADTGVGSVNAQVRFMSAPEVINTTGLEIDALGVAYDRRVGRPAAEEGSEAEEVFGVSGCVALYRIDMLSQIGGFDAAFFAYAEDADVAWRARMKGWRAVYVPRAVAFHHGSATAGDGSTRKYFLVGRNRVRLLAKNATTAQLVRWGWAIVAYDLAYVVFVALSEQTFAPLRGRWRGLREWSQARQVGATSRQPVRLCGLGGWRQAITMRAAYARASRSP